MLTLEQREEAITALSAAINHGRTDPRATGKVYLGMDLYEAQALIDTLNYPFPSADVLLPYAERQSDRERAIADAISQVPADVHCVPARTDDIRYLVERNNFLRDTLGSVGEEVGEISRRVDKIEAGGETPSQTLADGLEAEVRFAARARELDEDEAKALEVLTDIFRGGTINNLPVEYLMNLIIGDPHVKVTEEAAKAPPEILALATHQILQTVREHGDAVQTAMLSVVDGEFTLDLHVET